MKYFAYGSNMNPKRMKERGVDFEKRVPGVLKGYELKFNRIWQLQYSGFAVANIVQNAETIVEGAVYTMPDEDIHKLDVFEGYPHEYTRKQVTVILLDGRN